MDRSVALKIDEARKILGCTKKPPYQCEKVVGVSRKVTYSKHKNNLIFKGWKM
jgi:hypothetical protein